MLLLSPQSDLFVFAVYDSNHLTHTDSYTQQKQTCLNETYHKWRNICGHNSSWGNFSWLRVATVITVANIPSVQIFVGLIFVGVADHKN